MTDRLNLDSQDAPSYESDSKIYYFRLQDWTGFEAIADSPEPHDIALPEAEASSLSVPRLHSLSTVIDEDGGFIVQDIVGAVYGYGPTYQAAQTDYLTSLDNHLAYLRTHENQLGPRLTRQFHQLRRLFPSR